MPKNTPVAGQSVKKAPARKRKPPRKPDPKNPKRGPLPAPDRAKARQKQPIVNRALRDLRLVEWQADGVHISEIVRRDGRTKRTIIGILEAHREHGIIGGAKLLNQDPVTVMKRILDRAELHYQLAFETAIEADAVGQKIQAVRTMIEAQDRLIELSQHLGILPKHLGTFRHVIDLRQIGEQMVEALQAVQRGDKTLEDALVFFRELAGYGTPDQNVIEGTVEAA